MWLFGDYVSKTIKKVHFSPYSYLFCTCQSHTHTNKHRKFVVVSMVPQKNNNNDHFFVVLSSKQFQSHINTPPTCFSLFLIKVHKNFIKYIVENNTNQNRIDIHSNMRSIIVHRPFKYQNICGDIPIASPFSP